MALVKYNPLRELRSMQEQMNKLLNVSWNHDVSGEDLKDGIWQPAVDIYETADSIVIKAELPDVDQKDIDVRIEDNTLTLRGERRHEDEVKKENYHRIERYFGTFQRSFSLPATVDQEKVGALGKRDVPDSLLRDQVEKLQVDRISGKGLEGERRHELGRRVGHHDMHRGARLGQQAQQLHRLVDRDPASHPEDDDFSFQHCAPFSNR